MKKNHLHELPLLPLKVRGSGRGWHRAAAKFRGNCDNCFLSKQPERAGFRVEDLVCNCSLCHWLGQETSPLTSTGLGFYHKLCPSLSVMRALYVILLQSNKRPFTLDLTCQGGNKHICFDVTRHHRSSQILIWHPNVAHEVSKSLFCPL